MRVTLFSLLFLLFSATGFAQVPVARMVAVQGGISNWKNLFN